MKYFGAAILGTLALTLAPVTQATQTWTEGSQYDVITPAQHTNVPAGKVEVMEVFSYGCPSCNGFQPVMAALQHSLPSNARMVFLPASFHPEEDWTMLQRAYFTAQALGISERTHQAIFDAVWKNGELSIVDLQTNRPKNPEPTIQDAAKVYNKLTGIPVDKFLAVSQSFAVEVKMKADDAYLVHAQADSTPTIVVNGKYRLNVSSAGGADQVIQLVKYLVNKESH